MNICNENGIYIPPSSCDCDEVMQALVAYKKEVQALLDDIEEAIAKKQNILTSGANIPIRNDVISAQSGRMPVRSRSSIGRIPSCGC